MCIDTLKISTTGRKERKEISIQKEKGREKGLAILYRQEGKTAGHLYSLNKPACKEKQMTRQEGKQGKLINPEPDRKGKQAAFHPAYARQERTEKAGKNTACSGKNLVHIKQGRMKQA